jgi:phosphatidylserine decarboxylase
MKIHKEGYTIILSTAVTILLLNVILYRLTGRCSLMYFTSVVSVAFILLIINFFRSPSRIFSGDTKNLIVSPADGKIVVVEEVDENEYFHEKRLQVSVFMSLFNAHVNWYPCNGKILYYTHQDGRFRAAYLPKSSIENERSTVVVDLENGEKLLIRQIAGAMAKRIVTYAKEGSDCKINQQLGFIKFGSRVDMYLPLTADINVKIGDTVRGNKTVIAKL